MSGISWRVSDPIHVRSLSSAHPHSYAHHRCGNEEINDEKPFPACVGI